MAAKPPVPLPAGGVPLAGFEELAKKLREIPLALRKRVLRNALAAGGRLVRDEARRIARAGFNKGTAKAPYRKVGTVVNAISVRTSKQARKDGNVGVFVNVKPLKGEKYTFTTMFIQRGKPVAQKRTGYRGVNKWNPDNPFYWKFQEFGWTPASKRPGLATKLQRRHSPTRSIPGIKFLTKSANMLPAALDIFQTKVGAWFAKTEASGKVTP